MSRRLLMAWLVPMALVASTGNAQDVGEQERVLDSVAAVQRRAAQRLRLFDDSSARARAAMDTVQVGVFHLLVQAGNRDVAAAGALLGTDSLRPMGDSVLALLRTNVFVVRRAPVPRWSSRDVEPVVVAILDSAGVEVRQLWDHEVNARAIAAYLVDHARAVIAGKVDPRFSAWMSAGAVGTPIQFDTVTAFGWSQSRLDLVSSPSLVARRCYDGNLRDCRVVLGFDSSAAPAREYYDSAGRVELVRRQSNFLSRRDARTETCLAGSDAVCLDILEERLIPLPVASSGHRVALTQLAMQLGGPAARVRAFRPMTSPEAQLAAIAGIPTDSLVRVWHSRVRSVRTPSDTMTSGMALASLGWIGLLGVLALRNRRWR